MSSYKVLIVDDSAFMRKLITDFVSGDPEFQVVGTARSGRDALDKIKRLRPDVVTMDIEMPEMNGLEALEAIMADNPLPVVMLSSLTQEGAKETIRALELGAVDFVGKPSGSISLDLHKVRSLLIEKLRIAVRSSVRRSAALPKLPLAPAPSPPPAVPAPPVPSPEGPSLSMPRRRQAGAAVPFRHLVAIGTSTGGPRALHYLLAQLPAEFPAPILVVQHMPPNFTRSLAQRIDGNASIRVVEAEDGEPIVPGTAYIAPGGQHMRAAGGRSGGLEVRLTREEPRGGHRPSVDVLFESLLPYGGLMRHIVLMTGMGSDGARGMKSLLDVGAQTTIAESEETCVVYGMPRAAVELGGAMHVLPLHEIPGKLLEAVKR